MPRAPESVSQISSSLSFVFEWKTVTSLMYACAMYEEAVGYLLWLLLLLFGNSRAQWPVSLQTALCFSLHFVFFFKFSILFLWSNFVDLPGWLLFLFKLRACIWRATVGVLSFVSQRRLSSRISRPISLSDFLSASGLHSHAMRENLTGKLHNIFDCIAVSDGLSSESARCLQMHSSS